MPIANVGIGDPAGNAHPLGRSSSHHKAPGVRGCFA